MKIKITKEYEIDEECFEKAQTKAINKFVIELNRVMERYDETGSLNTTNLDIGVFEVCEINIVYDM